MHSKKEYNGVPIMAANMDTIGTFDIAVEMCKQSLFTAIDKHRSIDEWKKFRDEHPE